MLHINAMDGSINGQIYAKKENLGKQKHYTKNEGFHKGFLQCIWPNLQFAAGLVTFTEEMLYGKLTTTGKVYLIIKNQSTLWPWSNSYLTFIHASASNFWNLIPDLITSNMAVSYSKALLTRKRKINKNKVICYEKNC